MRPFVYPMIVYVKLYATLRPRFPELGIGEEAAVELPAGATVADLISQLALPDLAKVVFVNHAVRVGEHLLQEGDRVAIFPPVGGG